MYIYSDTYGNITFCDNSFHFDTTICGNIISYINEEFINNNTDGPNMNTNGNRNGNNGNNKNETIKSIDITSLSTGNLFESNPRTVTLLQFSITDLLQNLRVSHNSKSGSNNTPMFKGISSPSYSYSQPQSPSRDPMSPTDASKVIPMMTPAGSSSQPPTAVLLFGIIDVNTDDSLQITYQCIDSGDITFNSLESMSFGNEYGYFNRYHGYQHILYSQIEILLDTIETFSLFSDCWNDGNNDIDISLTKKWSVREVTDLNNISTLFYSGDINSLSDTYHKYNIIKHGLMLELLKLIYIL